MEKSKLKSQVTPQNIIFSILGLIAFIFTLYYFLGGLAKNKTSEISPDQIKLQKGTKTVIVNGNGVIEYYSESGIYYDYWDEGRTKNFFDHIRQVAREYLASPPENEGEGGYYVTLYLDGKEVKIWVADDDEVVNEVFLADPSGEGGGGGSLDDYFEDYFNPTPTGTFTGSVSPTTTPSGPGVVSAGSGQTPSGGGGEVTQSPVDCSLYQAAVSGRTIISNALCVDPETIKSGQ